MRVLVTGGTGYLGRAIVRALDARGHEPVVFARRASTAGLPGAAVDGDVRDRTALIDAARGCEVICHAAALVSIWRPHPAEYDAVNVGGLRHALDALRESGVRRLVYTSSFLALPPAGRAAPLSANDYQRTKTIAAGLAARAREAGAPVVSLYPGVVYGPGPESESNLVGRLLADFVRGRLPGIVGPHRIWSFTWIDDAAAAHVAAAEHASPAGEYAIAGDNQPVMRMFEVARAQGVARRLPRSLSPALVAALGAAEELRARLTGRTPAVTRRTVEIFRHDWPLDAAAAARDLNLRVTPLDAGIARTLASWHPAGTPVRRTT